MTAGPQRRLILHMSVSLDGFVARSDGVIDWLTPRDETAVDHGDQRHRLNLEMLGQIGLIVIGRGAYEDMVQAWPGTKSPMGVLMDTLPKVVFSQSLSPRGRLGQRAPQRAPARRGDPRAQARARQ